MYLDINSNEFRYQKQFKARVVRNQHIMEVSTDLREVIYMYNYTYLDTGSLSGNASLLPLDNNSSTRPLPGKEYHRLGFVSVYHCHKLPSNPFIPSKESNPPPLMKSITYL